MRRLAVTMVAFLAASAFSCGKKSDANVTPDPGPSVAATSQATPTPMPPASARADDPSAAAQGKAASSGRGASPGAALPAATPPASTGSAAPSVSVVASASAAPSAPPAKPLVAANPVSAHTAGPHYSVDVSAPGNCEANHDCVATIRIQALDGYHVNPEYSHKFIGTESPSIRYVGGDTFSKAMGAFALEGEKVGALTVRFQGTASGTATLAGTVKTCVCTEEECMPTQVGISLGVPIQ